MSSTQHADILIRRAALPDSEACGQICFQAFSTLNAAHGFPCDFPHTEACIGLFSMLFAAPGLYCVVAEHNGRVVGSNILDERASICGVGPVTVDPAVQNLRVGRRLMQDALNRAQQKRAAGVRLVQAAFHTRSLSLYASLGFVVREPLACMQGRTSERSLPGCTVRAATPADLNACNALSREVHGFDRGTDLAHAIHAGTARAVERGGRITGYSSHLAFFGHTTAETNLDLQALIASAESFDGPGILVPTRNGQVFSWCLANGLRVVQPMNLMSLGLYNEPAGAFLPSVLF